MVLVELSPAEIAKRTAKREATDQNIEFLKSLIRVKGKIAPYRTTSPNGSRVLVCDGRYVRKNKMDHLREEVHVLVTKPGNETVVPDVHYAICYGRLDVEKRVGDKLQPTTQINFQDDMYDMVVCAVTLMVKLSRPIAPLSRENRKSLRTLELIQRASPQLPLPVDNP